MPQRPDKFTLNRNHQLAKGLVFAGLGAMAGGKHCHDSSVFGRHGTLTANANPVEWRYVPQLGRMAMYTGGETDYVVLPTVNIPSSTPCTIMAWINNTVAQDYPTVFGGVSGVSVDYDSLRLFAASTPGVIAMRLNGSSVTPATTSLTRNTWWHICARRGADNKWSYFTNGKNDSPGTLGTNNAAFAIGRLFAAHNDSTRSFSGYISDPMMVIGVSSDSAISAYADPSNVMLSGLILPPARKWWPVVSGGGPAASTIPVFMHHRRLMGAA